MTPGEPVPLSGDLFDLPALLGSLAEVADWASFCEKLQHGLPRLLPATRVDIYTIDGHGAIDARFTTDVPSGVYHVPLPAQHDLPSWFEQQGYQLVVVLPLVAAGRPTGWLVLAQAQRECAELLRAFGGQLAPLIGMRLQYELLRSDLIRSVAQITSLERRLHTTDALRLRAVLATGTAHDIGNIFTTVIGHAQLLQQDVPLSFQSDIGMILRAAEDGRFLLRRLQSGASHFAAPAANLVALPDLIDDVIQLTRPIWERSDRKVVVQLDMHEVPLVQARAVELREVLTNLIMNAIAAMPHGGAITIGCDVAADQASVTVADTGHGIALDRLKDIFQPLSSSRDHGSGLGLSVSRAIVESYGGTLTAISAPGAGATFTMTLPAFQRDRAVSTD